MPHDWIIEVLDDLKSYAQQNALDALATQIEDTRLVALTEIASSPGSCHGIHQAAASPLTRSR